MNSKMDRYSRDRNQVALENSIYCLCLFKDIVDRYFHADSWSVSGGEIRRKAHHTAPWEVLERIHETIRIAREIKAREIEYSYGDAILRRANEMDTLERIHFTMELRQLTDELVDGMKAVTLRDSFIGDGKYYLYNGAGNQTPDDIYQLMLEKLHGVTDYGRARKASE